MFLLSIRRRFLLPIFAFLHAFSLRFQSVYPIAFTCLLAYLRGSVSLSVRNYIPSRSSKGFSQSIHLCLHAFSLHLEVWSVYPFVFTCLLASLVSQSVRVSFSLLKGVHSVYPIAFTCLLASLRSSVSLSIRFYIPSRLSKRSVYPFVFTFPLAPLRGSVPSRFSKKFGQSIYLFLHAFSLLKGFQSVYPFVFTCPLV